MQCTPDLPSDEATSDDPSDSAGCTAAGAQYQPDETQYQTPASTTCGASGDSVVPISEPDAPAPSSVVAPTTEPVDVPVAPDTEPTQSGVDVLPAPDSPPPATTKVVGKRPGGTLRRRRPAGSVQQAQAERLIPAQVRSVSPSLPVRPRPVRAPSKPKTSVSRSKVEAAAPQILEPASSRGNLLGDWLLLALPLSFVFALGLLLPAAAIAGRSLRARVQSKGLSDHHLGTNSSVGIRYRD